MAGIPGQFRDTGKGPYRQQTANWKATYIVNAGDLCYLDTADTNSAGAGYDKSASYFPWAGSLLLTQTAFKAVFRGISAVRRVAAQTTDGTQTTDGGILADGEFTFPCLSLGSAVQANTFVTIAQNGVANSLNPALVAPTTNPMIAIGRVTQYAAVGATQLTFEVYPYGFDGGVVPDCSIGLPAASSYANGLTAHAGGGQASGWPITTEISQFTTVATAADSATLPVSVPGTQCMVANGAASNSMNVFPPVGSAINAAVSNTAFALAAGKNALFYCVSPTQWHAILSS